MKDELKQLGLESLENLSKEAVHDLFKLMVIIINDSENKLDDTLLPFLPQIEAFVIAKLDTIAP